MPAAGGRVLPVATIALLIVDLQKDFCPGGALPVAEGDRVIPIAARLVERFARAGLPIAATRDWHPPDHCSFAAQGGPWPVHCVAGSPGARFHEGLRLPAGARVVDKGTLASEEAYSGFQGTDLAEWLSARAVRRIVVCGLATDYCVKHTVLDARRAGFDVTVVEDAIRAVDVRPGDGARALDAMRDAGARVTLCATLQISRAS